MTPAAPLPGALRSPAGRARELALEGGRRAVRGYGQLTARWRPDPEFLIIGAKRGGSTSFYYDLLEHPQVCPLFPRPDHLPKAAATKGIHYFDQNFERGERWYRAHLPSRFARAAQRRRVGAPVVVGEASPYYLFHPAAAERAAQLLPDARIVVVLRDPVMRAYSHWKERRRNDMEPLDFAAALAAEDGRVGAVEDRLRTDPAFHSYAHEQQSYARQSEYDTALQRWYDRYPRDRILVLCSEEYYAAPRQALDAAAAFLGISVGAVAGGSVRNAAGGERLDAGVEAALRERFAPHNEALRRLTGRDFPWS